MATYAKAIAGGIAAALGSLALLLTGDEGLDSVTTAEWIVVAINVLGSYGVVWAVPNKPTP